MLARLKGLINPVKAVATPNTAPTTIRGRFSQFRKVKTIPNATAGNGATASTPAPTQTPTGFDGKKILRGGLMLLGVSIFVTRLVADPGNPNSLVNRILNPKTKKNLVLKVEKLDDAIASYNTAFVGASEGFKPALKNQQRYQLAKRLGADLHDLTDEQWNQLFAAGKLYRTVLEQNSDALERLKHQQLQSIRSHSLHIGKLQELSKKKLSSGESEHAAEDSSKTSNDVTKEVNEADKLVDEELRKATLKVLDQKIQIELNFMRAIESIFSAEQKTRLKLGENPDIVSKLKNSMLGYDISNYDFIMDKISRVSALPSYRNRRVFVLSFNGDMRAKQVDFLREEITAVLSLTDAKRGDEVVVQLNSGGGTVTGYGHGAAQLMRIRNAGLPLTVVVDEVAASGGYMMACVANRIIASPFALLGSVGVVATVPNFSDRLQREGVSVEDVTAGKYKRTLTPYKKPTSEDRAKVKSDVENILVLFKDFVKSKRPHLDIEKIATGETWHGPQALELGLVDELKTLDELLLDLRREGADVYSVRLKQVRPTLFDDDNELSSSTWDRVKSWATDFLSSAIQSAFENAIYGGTLSNNSLDTENFSSPVMAVNLNNNPRI